MMTHSLFLALALVGCNDKGGDSNAPANQDADGDGFAVPDDCNDGDSAIHPDATEVCDSVDNDCDGTTDVGAEDAAPYYIDGDADMYGTGTPTMSCTPVSGMVADAGDCDDANKAINPAATEICDDLDTDEDCDALSDDADDSVDASTATMMLYLDADSDGFGDEDEAVASCDAISGYVAISGDCDDASVAVNPDASEVCGDTIDDDCDGEAPSCVRWDGDLYAADADAELLGDVWDLEFGYDATPAGDTNGDGIGDLAVATNQNGGGYLFLGPISSTSTGKADAVFEYETWNDYTGSDVQGIGDQDGDGYDDLLVEAAGYSGGWSTGRAYVILGPMSGAATADSLSSATITGEAYIDYMGWYPSAGDVNDDGVVDIMLGAPGSGGHSEGASFVYFGPVTGYLTQGDADVSFFGLAANDWTGGCNAANGDIDGDGIDDMLVSAEESDYLLVDDGVAWLFYGPVSGEHNVDEADAHVYGAPANTHLGWSTSIGGDIDGDGGDDLAVSAPNYSDGNVYVFYADSVVATSDLDVSKADAWIAGDPATNDSFGSYIDSGGDLDADGNDELAVGAPGSNGADGTAWGFYGPISGSLSATADASFIVHGASSSRQRMGAATVFVGDMGGDGRDDLAVGAWSTRNGATGDAGAVYLFNGK